jgi:hypothetical protein
MMTLEPNQRKNILVIAPNPWSVQEIARLNQIYNFIFLEDQFQKEKMSVIDKLRLIRGLKFKKYIDKAIQMARLRNIDAILGPDEFISCLYASAASEKLGLASNSMQLELSFQHKYYSRLLQQKFVPEAVPKFGILKVDAPPPFPFFAKPIRGSASLMAQRLNSKEELKSFLKIPMMKKLFYMRMLSTFENIAEKFGGLKKIGSPLIYEEVLSGEQYTLEAYVHEGEHHFVGVVDSVMYPQSKISFSKFVFPSRLPEAIQSRMREIAERLMKGAGYKFGFYNIEFFYNEKTDDLKIIEINPRMAFQFTDLYEKVLGFNTFDLWLKMLTRSKVDKLKDSPRGKHRFAASLVLRSFQDGFVEKTPSSEDFLKIEKEFDARIMKMAIAGMQLSSDIFQDVESFRLMTVNLGGESVQEIEEKYQSIVSRLPFNIRYKK